ncbi:MAG: immune inhibitor A [Anaerolineae bacterium]|nr:immune inhibitor A [Anaerolineae bacterium]
MKNFSRYSRSSLIVAILVITIAALLPAPAGARVTEGLDIQTLAGTTQQRDPGSDALASPAIDPGKDWTIMTLPPAHQVEKILQDGGAIPMDASPAQLQTTIEQWYKDALKDYYTGPDLEAMRVLKEREATFLDDDPSNNPEALPPRNIMAVVVDFDGTDTITRPYPDPDNPDGACVPTESTWGPLALGEDPPPGADDNFTFYLPDPSVAQYQEAIFGVGPDAGYGIIDHPTLGPVDLRGYTLQNYLLEMSRGAYQIGGAVLPEPVAVNHSQEYYGHAVYDDDNGAGACTSPLFSDAHPGEYIYDVIDAVKDQYQDTLDCSQFDANGDHVIDLLVTIHAGYGFQNGGGEDRLNTSSSGFYWDPYFQRPKICGFSTPLNLTDDYYVAGYNIDPEQLAVGALQEEFEHQLGLPDLYTIDASANSNGWWGANSVGVWGGPLSGTRPVGHNLWQDFVLGWRNPVIINYDDPALELTIGRARNTPEGTEDGLIVRLPDAEQTIPNLAGAGNGWWTEPENFASQTATRDFNLRNATAPVVFSFDSFWDIENNRDYGYVQVSTNSGLTWTTLPDMDGVLTDSNPYGFNLGWGLTGSGSGTLRFDLSDYTGQTIRLRFTYQTDFTVVEPGWWVDNLLLTDANGTLYENDLDTDFSDWTLNGWVITPSAYTTPRYYLFEWRDDNGFDRSLNDPYNTEYAVAGGPPPTNIVGRMPATTPGMTVSLRDAAQDFDYEISSDICEPPSCGPKFGLLVVESNNFPKRFDTTFPNLQGGWVGPTPSGRTLSGDATFGHTPTEAWTASLGLDYTTGHYVQPPIETKSWPSLPATPAFHDSYGYYPGFFYPGSGSSLYFNYFAASAVLPAQDDYSTRVTLPDSTPLPQLYGLPVGPGGLGTGNPGDDHVQYGVHVEVMDQSDEQATIRFWNAMTDFDGMITQTPSTNPVVVGTYVDVALSATNIGGALQDALIVVPIDTDSVYVPGSAYGGAFPVTAAYAAQLAIEHGLTDLTALATSAMPDDVVAVAWMGDAPTSDMIDFGFSVQITNAPAEVQHSADVYDGLTLVASIDGDALPVVDNSTYPVNRSMRFNVDRDSYINGSQPNTYYGSDQTMWLGFYDQMRPVVHTPLNGIPGDSPVDQAWLYLYVTEGRKFGNWSQSVLEDVTAHPATTEWMPYAVNWWMPWTMPGGDYGPGGSSNHLGSGKIGTWLRLDITAAVQDMLRSGLNQGFLINSDAISSGVHYGLATKEYWDPSKAGYIRVHYRTAD